MPVMRDLSLTDKRLTRQHDAPLPIPDKKILYRQSGFFEPAHQYQKHDRNDDDLIDYMRNLCRREELASNRPYGAYNDTGHAQELATSKPKTIASGLFG